MGKTVFVDLDGVVADFVGGVFALHKDTIPSEKADQIITNMRGSYDIVESLGMTPGNFWRQIDQDNLFWENLLLTDEAVSLMAQLEKHPKKPDIYFLSSPALSPSCYYGKASWVQKNFPKYINKLILTGHKNFLANRDRILIDDSDMNIDKFRVSGGLGVIFPRPWNSKYQFSRTPMTLVIAELNRLL